MTFKAHLMCGLAAGVFAFAGAAHAQDNSDSAQSGDNTEDVIVVTGSNIAGASDSGAIAVSTLSKDDLDALGQVSTGELFENLPQAGSFEINDSADGPNDARGDVATVNLRGLGSGNTLVLLNGRRITPHGVFQDVGTVPRSVTNVNAFPAAAIQRVEVLRDGASALYGSDATAGVVNTILSADFEDTRVTFRTSGIEGTGEREQVADFATGFTFNEGDTHLLLVGSVFQRDGLYATELDDQFARVDKRGVLGDSPYADANTDFRNTSTRSPFGQFRVGALTPAGTFEPIDVGGLTASDGDFHVQPCSFSGTREELGTLYAGAGCVGLDDGNLNSGLRLDFNNFQPNNALGEGIDLPLTGRDALGRQLISDAVRYNAYALLEHDFDNGVQGFAEALFYQSETESQRAAQPIDDGLAFVVVPAQNYWNPVGPIGSPNRVAGITAPAEGLDVLISRWRPLEMGPRIYAVDSQMYRLLGGFRGDLGNWDWETAVGYSRNETEDTSYNRISKQSLYEQLSLTTPEAINPFGGPFANSQEQMDRVRIDVSNVGTTSLTTADFRMSNPEMFDWFAGPIGGAWGVDYRRESYEENRDPRLDGSIQFTSGSGDVSDRSDVVGVSPTADSSASRNVFAAYGEVLVPLYRSDNPVWINEWNLQLAARGEYFDDIEDGAVKPKVALSWFPVDNLNLRAAYSQGFRAPNLIQLNRGDISRLNRGDTDFYRAPVTGEPSDLGETYRASLRRSNPDLRNEDTETVVIGATWDATDLVGTSWLTDLRFSLDYWQFEQTDLIGTLDPETQLAIDYQMLLAGSSNPNVVRAPVTATDQAAFDAYNAANGTNLAAVGEVQYVIDDYINLDSQTAAGYDFGVSMGIDSAQFGRFDINIETTRMVELELVRNPIIQQLIDDPDVGGNFAALDPDRLELNGNPLWRTTGTLTWRNAGWGAGLSARYVSGFYDTSADPDLDGDGNPDFFPVDEYLRINTYVDYRFHPEQVDSFRVRVGVNNVFDETPPILDESRGYDPSYHSVRGRSFYVQLRATL